MSLPCPGLQTRNAGKQPRLAGLLRSATNNLQGTINVNRIVVGIKSGGRNEVRAFVLTP